MEFLQFIILFALGFALGYCLFLYHYHKSEITNLLTTIKEDISNLTVKLAEK